MMPSCVEPLALYRPRDPHASDLWRLMDQHFATFQQVYDERFQARYGFWRPLVERSVAAFLKCGDLHEGVARVRCPDCLHEMFVAYSCKQRCTCPSCHQKRALLTAIHVAQEVSFAWLQSDSWRTGVGSIGVGPIALENQFQGNTSNAQSVSTDSVVEDFERSVVRGIAGGHCPPHRRSPSRSHGTAKSQTPSQTLPILM